jgi:hypothetical protein
VHERDEARRLSQARQARVVLQEDQARVVREERLVQRIQRGLDVAQCRVRGRDRGRRHVARLRQDEQLIRYRACLVAFADACKVRPEQGQRPGRAIGQDDAAAHLDNGFDTPSLAGRINAYADPVAARQAFADRRPMGRLA